MERYRRYLEHVYGLCGKCERAVDETISKQDNGLQRKIEQLHRRSEQHHDVSASDSFQTVNIILLADLTPIMIWVILSKILKIDALELLGQFH